MHQRDLLENETRSKSVNFSVACTCIKMYSYLFAKTQKSHELIFLLQYFSLLHNEVIVGKMTLGSNAVNERCAGMCKFHFLSSATKAQGNAYRAQSPQLFLIFVTRWLITRVYPRMLFCLIPQDEIISCFA